MVIPLAATRHGSGPLLVCHPGGPGMHPDYLDPLAALARTRQVVLVHPRGTGDSPRPDRPDDYAPTAYAADLADWLDRHAGGPVPVLGHSHGGVVASLLAAARPDLVSALVLLATPAYGGDRAVAEAESSQEARRSEPACAAALDALAGQGDDYPDDAGLGVLLGRVLPLWLGPMTPAAVRWQRRVAAAPANVDALRYFNEKVFPDLDHAVRVSGAIRCPTLAVAGRLDGWAGPAHLPLLVRRLDRARTVVVEGSGHMCHVDATDAVVAAVDQFLRTEGGQW